MNKKELKKRKKIIYDLVCSKEYIPMRTKEIAILLDIPKSMRNDLQKVLDALLEDGKISVSKQGKYRKTKERKYKKKETSGNIVGIYTGHPRGYGFVTPEDQKEGDDIFIPEEYTGAAFHMDRVEVKIDDTVIQGKRKEGRIVKILEHGIKEVVGTYQQSRHYGFVVPDIKKIQQDIFIPMEWSGNAEDGEKVVAVITSYGSKNKSPEGRIKEVIGDLSEPGVDILAIVKGLGLPTEFPEKVLKQAGRISQTVIQGDFQGRRDLREKICVTIDGEDAKDLDDAISIEKTDSGYELGVHIADVSNYVQAGSALDREARRRGTSVYLADRVIPMIPKELSNGICSLNQGEDRLTLSCIMKLNAKGKVIQHEIVETVIQVDKRMSYTDVWSILQGDKETQEKYLELVPMFFLMEELSALIRKRRSKRGAIQFDFPESKVILDSQGHPLAIKAYERNRATELIEDFMLIANETVARECFEKKLPFIYRIHEEPESDKIENVLSMVRALHISVQKQNNEISPKEVNKILDSIKGKDGETMISRLLLRSMQQARYATENEGHFGLAAEYYTHFTSPIRRYPDLQIHRIIKDMLRGRMNDDKIQNYKGILGEVASQSSTCERRAEEAERETVKLKKAEYMLDHIGEEYPGIISGVTGWGIYVELENTIEGLVPVNAMTDDYYLYDEQHHKLTGERTGKQYELGQKVRIKVEDVDLAVRTIDFNLVKEEKEY